MTHPSTVQVNGALDSARHYTPDMLTEQPCRVCGYRVPLALKMSVHPCCDPGDST